MQNLGVKRLVIDSLAAFEMDCRWRRASVLTFVNRSTG